MADEEDEKKSGGNKKLVIILVAALAVVLVAGGVVVMTLLNSQKAQAEPDPATVNGAVYSMEEPMTLNLSDGKFLKMNMAIQMSKAGDEALVEAGGDPAVGPDLSKARDAAIGVLSTYKYDELLKPEKKAEAQKKLGDEVKQRYEGEVIDVYFTEFVMQ